MTPSLADVMAAAERADDRMQRSAQWIQDMSMTARDPSLVSDLKPRGIKPDLSLLPYRPLRAIAAAFEDGMLRYRRNNWRHQGDAKDWRETYTAAMLRHVNAYADPEFADKDEHSGVHHLAYACACGMILLYLEGVDYERPHTV